METKANDSLRQLRPPATKGEVMKKHQRDSQGKAIPYWKTAYAIRREEARRNRDWQALIKRYSDKINAI